MEEAKTIARPYAKAVFEIAQARGQLNEWSQFLQACSTVSKDKQVVGLISSPGLDSKNIAQAIYELANEINETDYSNEFLNFLLVLAGNSRLTTLSEISAQFEERKRSEEQIAEVTIRSATEIDKEALTKIENALKEKLNKSIEVVVEIDKKLIGGAKIKIGDHMIDGSLKAQLSSLGRALLN